MKLKLKAAISFAAVWIFFCAAVITAYAENYRDVIDGIIGFKLNQYGAADVQEWLDGELTENVGKSSEWYVYALAQSGDYDFTAYTNALEAYVSENDIKSPVSRQKYALVLMAAGSEIDFIEETAETTAGQQGIMSLVYGLHLLNNGCSCGEYTAEKVITEINALQLEDGGWAITGEYGDVDVTAMVLQALAPHYNDEAVKTAVDKALVLLSERQLDGGDFASYGVPCAESTAQVITALSALGIDPVSDIRFIKNENTVFDGLNKYRLSDGSFSHKEGGDADSNATVQAFYSLTAYKLMTEGKGSLYIINNTKSAVQSETEIMPAEEAETTVAVTEKEKVSQTAEKKAMGYKPVVCTIIAGAAVLGYVALFILKKNKKNYIAVAVIAAAGMLFVCFTDFQTAENYYGNDIIKENPIGTVTMTIRCDTVAGKAEHIPQNGVVLEETVFEIEENETVYDILTQAAKEYSVHVENSGGDRLVYISGINYLYEFDYGGLSGWMFFVNGEEASVGCDSFILSDGDRIEWLYTCEMGKDLK